MVWVSLASSKVVLYFGGNNKIFETKTILNFCNEKIMKFMQINRHSQRVENSMWSNDI